MRDQVYRKKRKTHEIFITMGYKRQLPHVLLLFILQTYPYFEVYCPVLKSQSDSQALDRGILLSPQCNSRKLVNRANFTIILTL